MQIDIITIFPDMVRAICTGSILGRAQKKDIIQINIHNLRDFASGKHSTVDDYSYGGGPGMILMPEPIFNAVESITGVKYPQSDKTIRVILPSPQGEVFIQQKAKELAREKRLIFLCGHYKGVDERIRKNLVTDEISIGDYVLTGGELPSLVIIDSVVRLLPKVLNKEESYKSDSFYGALLDYPHYTRPSEFREMSVPSVLLSCDHSKIEKWRKKMALENTFMKRPDLLDKIMLSEEEKKFLQTLK